MFPKYSTSPSRAQTSGATNHLHKYTRDNLSMAQRHSKRKRSMSNNKHNKSTRRTIDYEKSDQLNWKSFKCDSTQRPLRRVLSKSKNSKIMSEKNNISEAKVPLKDLQVHKKSYLNMKNSWRIKCHSKTGVKLLNNASRCDSGLRLNTSTSPNVMHKSNYSSTNFKRDDISSDIYTNSSQANHSKQNSHKKQGVFDLTSAGHVDNLYKFQFTKNYYHSKMEHNRAQRASMSHIGNRFNNFNRRKKSIHLMNQTTEINRQVSHENRTYISTSKTSIFMMDRQLPNVKDKTRRMPKASETQKISKMPMTVPPTKSLLKSRVNIDIIEEDPVTKETPKKQKR